MTDLMDKTGRRIPPPPFADRAARIPAHLAPNGVEIVIPGSPPRKAVIKVDPKPTIPPATPRGNKTPREKRKGPKKLDGPTGTGLSKGQRRRLNVKRRSNGLPPIGDTL